MQICKCLFSLMFCTEMIDTYALTTDRPHIHKRIPTNYNNYTPKQALTMDTD